MPSLGKKLSINVADHPESSYGQKDGGWRVTWRRGRVSSLKYEI